VQYTNPFLTVRSLSPRSTTTKLYIFHSCYSFLLVAGGDSLTHQDLSSQCGESRRSCAVSERSCFYAVERLRTLASRTQICGTPGHWSLKQIELRLSRKTGTNWISAFLGTYCLHNSPSLEPIYSAPPFPIPVRLK
jgi:hypothetical protein